MTTKNLSVVFWLSLSACAMAGAALAATSTPKFYADDPVARLSDSQDASGVEAREINLFYDTLENSFSWPGDRTPNVRAKNLNTVDEVPDSAWFTNRLGSYEMDTAALVRGPNTVAGPAPGEWIVVSAKSDGVTPGFTIRDSAGQVWFVKVDPPGYRAMATGTEVVVTKLLWALGYNVPEVHLATLRPEDLVIGEAAQVTPPSGRRRAFRRGDLNRILGRAHRDPDGSYRVVASKALEGRPVGGFLFYGTRPDDPNDIVPHEHRRELRAYGTFAAWLNHVDSKSINTLDTVVEEDGRSIVRHHLLDFGSTIGSAGVYPREPFEGWEYLVEGKRTLVGIPTFGFYVKTWRTIPTFRSTSVGAFPADHSTWDPEQWKPRYGNSAFRSARYDDKFWAARRLQFFTDDMLDAVVGVGQFGDAESERMLATFLKDRRDAIVARYLPAANPIVNVRMNNDSTLSFGNAAVDAGVSLAPEGYTAVWNHFDNMTGVVASIATTRSSGSSIAAPVGLPAEIGSYIRVDIAAVAPAGAWTSPAHAYFVRRDGGWHLVGFERTPEEARSGLEP